MGMVMIVAAEGDGEADSSTPLGPGLLTPTSGPYESQRVVSSSYMDYMLLSTHPSHSFCSHKPGMNSMCLGGKPKNQRQQSTSLSGNQGDSG